MITVNVHYHTMLSEEKHEMHFSCDDMSDAAKIIGKTCVLLYELSYRTDSVTMLEVLNED